MGIFKHRPARIVLHVLAAASVTLGIFWWIHHWWEQAHRPPSSWRQGSSPS